MKLEDIAKTVIKDLEALEKDKRSLGENSANKGGENFDDDDLEIYSDIVLPDKKKSDLIAFNFHFDSLNSNSKNEAKNENINAEISDLANEKYDFADEKTDENLQNLNSQDEANFQNYENLEDKNEFVNLEFENQNLDFQSQDLQTIAQNLQIQTQSPTFKSQNLQNQNGQIEEFKKELNDILARFKNHKEDEIEFLRALRERIVVLFEGLNAFEGDLEARVELSIKFMEFLLASIDNRVENLSK